MRRRTSRPSSNLATARGRVAVEEGEFVLPLAGRQGRGFAASVAPLRPRAMTAAVVTGPRQLTCPSGARNRPFDGTPIRIRAAWSGRTVVMGCARGAVRPIAARGDEDGYVG